MSVNDLYTTGQYLQLNPGFHEEDAGWKAALVTGMLKKAGMTVNTVVEVGCGSGRMLHLVQQQLPGVPFKGYDISPQGIAKAKTLENAYLQYFEADLTGLAESADLLLMMDVLEHVPDYYGFLSALRDKATHFIFHIPLDASCRTIMKPHILLQQRQSVGHIHYFTKEMVWWMLGDCGYKIRDWQYTKPRTDVDAAKGLKRWIKKMLRNLSFSLLPNWSVKRWGGYSVLILAERS